MVNVLATSSHKQKLLVSLCKDTGFGKILAYNLWTWTSLHFSDSHCKTSTCIHGPMIYFICHMHYVYMKFLCFMQEQT